MYNIKKAVSRLDFAPKIEEIRVTDIKQGLGAFTPKPNKAASFAALRAALKKAGYTLASAEITVAGLLARDSFGWWIESEASGQRFALSGEGIDQVLAGHDAGARIEVSGDWQTVGSGTTARETIHPAVAKAVPALKSTSDDENRGDSTELYAIQVSVNGVGTGLSFFPAPVRTTSPGLTVYKGGAVTPRYFFIRQHLGSLDVTRHVLRLSASYTPTPTLQVEAEIPYATTSFEDQTHSGSDDGFGNLTVWGKYRFYRELETWGDRQAAIRFGMELPTGKSDDTKPSQSTDADFVRQQLSPIEGGPAFHSDVSYSQAHHRFVFGANIEGTVRAERDGFRMGHQIKVNTDFEYVMLPLKYQDPGHELFLILETTYSYRSRGQVNGTSVPGSSSSEFYLAPAVQFTASPRVVLEASYQFPVVLNSGPAVLRTDRNLLVGLKYLY
ncbi:MAG TPA: transporter [Blastocatellia bacterium]|nr:transporter [Blastocatellia bacterium]